MKLRYVFACFILLVIVSACAKPPITEMESARVALLTAESDANTVLYGRNFLLRARDAVIRMENAAASKQYDSAKTYANEAISLSEMAIAEGRTGLLRAREEAAAAILGLKEDVNEAGRIISAARYSSLDLNYDELDAELTNSYVLADLAEDDYARERYSDSIENAIKARDNVFYINQKVSGAVTRSK